MQATVGEGTTGADQEPFETDIQGQIAACTVAEDGRILCFVVERSCPGSLTYVPVHVRECSVSSSTRVCVCVCVCVCTYVQCVCGARVHSECSFTCMRMVWYGTTRHRPRHSHRSQIKFTYALNLYEHAPRKQRNKTAPTDAHDPYPNTNTVT